VVERVAVLKICSLLPSATEIACAIGLKDELVAVSHECDYPPDVRSLPKITRAVVDVKSLPSSQIDEVVKGRISKGLPLYEIDLELLAKLNPDLVLAQDLCRVCAVSSGQIHREVRRLGLKARVLPLDARNLREVLEAILTLGEFTDRRGEAREVVQQLRARSEAMIGRTLGIESRPRVLCLDWTEPPYVAGHWVPEMSYIAGGFDGLGVPGMPSRQVDWDEIIDYDPEYLLVMPCGYDARKAAEEARKLMGSEKVRTVQAVSSGRVFALDANALFSRPGPRLFDGLMIMGKILHPNLFGEFASEELAHVLRVG
jgi:iron complex transport system substrate-binding protein